MGDPDDEPAGASKLSPIEVVDRRTAEVVKTAAIWLGLAAALLLAWQLAAPILVLLAALILGIALDGATRLLGRVVALPHWARLSIVGLFIVAFLAGAALLIGNSLAFQAEAMSATLSAQLARLQAWAADVGVVVDAKAVQSAVLGGVSLGRVTGVMGNVLGGVAAITLIIVVGAYIAAEPKMYTRGLAWLTPRRHRASMETMYEHMAQTMRRWVGGRLAVMAADGILTAIGLTIAGVPLAGLLGLLSFLLAFIPNIGAAVAGALMVLVGLSVDTTTGLAAFAVYIVVQFTEGNLLNPYIERRVVDLAPAVVLAAQLLFGSLFGILGLALADPIVAMTKVAIDHRAQRIGAKPSPEG